MSNPTCSAITDRSKYARTEVLRGSASILEDGEVIRGIGEFVLPVEGAPIVAFRREDGSFADNFAAELHLTGNVGSTEFQLRAPICYTNKPSKGVDGGWSLVSPINKPVRVSYGVERPIHTAKVLLNNFNYDMGDVVTHERGFTRQGTPLSVQLIDREALFARRPDFDDVFPLVRAGLLRSASLVECGFDVGTESDDEILELSNHIATLCTFGAGASIAVAMLEFRDVDGGVVRQLVTQPIRSRYQHSAVVPDWHVPKLFHDSFAEHVKMQQSRLPWMKLPSYCGAMQDLPYLEQKFAALMMAIEFFTRTSLLESGAAPAWVESLTFGNLLGEARKKLGWELPKHYETGTATREFRNAIMHGSELPDDDIEKLRWRYDKWRLFLHRRVLARLGYTGDVESPHKGWANSSPVNDYSEEHNCFNPKDAESHPFAQFMTHLKEHQAAEKKRENDVEASRT